METLKFVSTIVRKIEQRLMPIALPEDDKTAAIVRPLIALCLFSLILMSIYIPAWMLIIPQHTERVVLQLVLLLPVLLSLWLIRRGYVRQARDIFLSGTWIITTITVSSAGGTLAPMFGVYTLLVMIAALLSNWWQAALYAGLTIVLTFIFVLSAPPDAVKPPFATPMSAWLTQSTIMGLVTVTAYFILSRTQQALRHARDALAEREQMQQSLRESEERFRLIASITSDYSFTTLINAQGELQHILLTGAFETISGYTPEEYLAIGGWRAILHPDDFEQDQWDMVHLRKNQRITTEVRIIRKDGEIRWVRVDAYPTWDKQNDRLVGINGGVRDITERKQAEAALNESEKRYRVTSEMISDYAFAYSIAPDKSITLYWITEDSFQRMTGYDWEEIGTSYDLYHPEDAAIAREHMERTIEGHPTSGEYRILTKNGELRWLRIHRQLEWNPDHSQPVLIYGVAQDITAQKRLEAELREYANQLEKLVDERTTALRRTKEQLELMLNNTANALAFAAPNGDILVTNPAYCSIFSTNEKQGIESILWALSNDAEITSVCNALMKAIYDNEHQRVETQVASNTSGEIDIELTLIPVSTTEREPRNGVLLSGHDITHLKEIERFKARFVADAVHDLATPIAGLSTRLYLLQHDPDRLNHHVRALENQVWHLRTLLEDLRTLSQMDRGQMILHKEQCDVNELVQRVFDTYEPVAITKKQTLELALTPTLPAISLDPKQIERVLLNLISNAINYTPAHKTIHIATALGNRSIVIIVTDQGIGIDADDLPHVFDRFYRTTEARTSVDSGSGLGLAITKEIVDLHDGTVSVTSERGRGSTFSIHLPLQP